MAELLVTEKDFELYRPLPATIMWGKIENIILRVQRGWVRDAITKKLYRDVHTNQSANKYAKLLTSSGSSYTNSNGNTIDFYGLKPAICLYAYATFIAENIITPTRSGNKVKQATQSEQATPQEIDKEYQKAMGEANMYMTEVLMYLRDKASTDDGITLYDAFRGRKSRGSIKVGAVRQRDFYSEDSNVYDYHYRQDTDYRYND